MIAIAVGEVLPVAIVGLVGVPTAVTAVIESGKTALKEMFTDTSAILAIISSLGTSAVKSARLVTVRVTHRSGDPTNIVIIS